MNNIFSFETHSILRASVAIGVVGCALINAALPAEANSSQRHEVIIDSPTKDNAKFPKKERSVKADKRIIVVLRNFNKLLYKVKTEGKLTDPAPLAAGTNPFAPSVKKATEGVKANSLSNKLMGQTLLDLNRLGTKLVTILVQAESDFRTQNQSKYPDVIGNSSKAAGEIIKTVFDLYVDLGEKAPFTLDETVNGELIVKAADNYYLLIGQKMKWDDIFKEFSDKDLSELQSLKNEKPKFDGNVKTAAHILDDILSLKQNAQGELEAEYDTGDETNEDQDYTLSLSITPQSKIEGEAIDGSKLATVGPKEVLKVAATTASGTYFSAFINGIHDQSFVVRTEMEGGAQVMKIRRRGAEDKANVSVGTMYNFADKKILGLNPSIGISTDGNQLNYHLGGSYRLDRKGKGLLTFGATLGQVKRLDGVQEGDTVTSNVVPTKDIYKLGFFVGLSLRGF